MLPHIHTPASLRELNASNSGSPSWRLPVNLNVLPEDYHNFADVFSKSKAGKLAEHQPYELKITLDEGTVPLFGPIYSLSQEELVASS